MIQEGWLCTQNLFFAHILTGEHKCQDNAFLPQEHLLPIPPTLNLSSVPLPLCQKWTQALPSFPYMESGQRLSSCLEAALIVLL
jgi:hypothetical protein